MKHRLVVEVKLSKRQEHILNRLSDQQKISYLMSFNGSKGRIGSVCDVKIDRKREDILEKKRKGLYLDKMRRTFRIH